MCLRLFSDFYFQHSSVTGTDFFHQRPVEWLLWCPSTEIGLVIIPEELELLISDIRMSRCTQLVAYAAPVTRSMLDFSSLNFFAFPPLPGENKIPTWLPIELGILAGRLYMTYDEAMDMTRYLGQHIDDDDELNDEVKKEEIGQFCANPTSFLLEWLPLRRTAQDVLHTPAAYVCQGRTLRPGHSFFLQSGARQIKEEEEEGDDVLIRHLKSLSLLDGNAKEEDEDEINGSPAPLQGALPGRDNQVKQENCEP